MNIQYYDPPSAETQAIIAARGDTWSIVPRPSVTEQPSAPPSYAEWISQQLAERGYSVPTDPMDPNVMTNVEFMTQLQEEYRQLNQDYVADMGQYDQSNQPQNTGDPTQTVPTGSVPPQTTGTGSGTGTAVPPPGGATNTTTTPPTTGGGGTETAAPGPTVHPIQAAAIAAGLTGNLTADQWGYFYQQAMGTPAPEPEQIGFTAANRNTPMSFAAWWAAVNGDPSQLPAGNGSGSGGGQAGGSTAPINVAKIATIGLGALALLRLFR